MAMQLSGKFGGRGGLSVGSRDVCLRSAAASQFGIFSCVWGCISVLAHGGPPKLSQIVCLVAMQLSGGFGEGLSVDFRDICLRSVADRQFGDVFLCLRRYLGFGMF